MKSLAAMAAVFMNESMLFGRAYPRDNNNREPHIRTKEEIKAIAKRKAQRAARKQQRKHK